MWANLTLDCIRSTKSTATGLFNLIWLKPNQHWCSYTHMHLKIPWLKWFLEDVKGLKTLVVCHCYPILSVSKQQAYTASKLYFFFFSLFKSDMFMFHQSGMISNSVLHILSLLSMCQSLSWNMPAVWVNLQQTTVIKQLLETFNFHFHPTTRLLLCLYCSETFTRPSF